MLRRGEFAIDRSICQPWAVTTFPGLQVWNILETLTVKAAHFMITFFFLFLMLALFGMLMFWGDVAEEWLLSLLVISITLGRRMTVELTTYTRLLPCMGTFHNS